MFADNAQRLENVAQSLRERTWWAYDSFGVTYGDWRLTIDRKPNVYKPFLFAVEGVRKARGFSLSRETWKRRYPSIDAALLHIFNEFNEDADVKNRFSTLDEAIRVVCGANAEADPLGEKRAKAEAARSASFGSLVSDGPEWWRMRNLSGTA